MRFLTDRMLGKLVRNLRIVGFDAVRLEDGADPVEQARRTRRILLTRNRSTARRCASLDIEHILILDNYPHGQTREVLGRTGLKDRLEPFSRCLDCNSVLEKVDGKEKVKGWVPPFVYDTQDSFSQCPGCGKYFWDATHIQSMERFLESILSDAS